MLDAVAMVTTISPTAFMLSPISVSERCKQDVSAGWMDYGNVPEARCMMGTEMNVERLVRLDQRQIMEI